MIVVRVLTLGIALLFATGVGGAEPSLLESRGPVTRHTLWKIEGSRSPVYLLGSIHVLRRQNYPLERPLEDAFDEAGIVAFEIDLDQARAMLTPPTSPTPPAGTRATPKPKPRQPAPGVRPAAPSLKTELAAATHQSMVRYLEEMGLPGTILDPLPPSLAAALLIQLQLHQMGFEPEWGVDAYFYRRAKKYGKTVVPLETVGEQLQAFGSLTDRGSDSLIQATLENVTTMRTMLRDLIRAWKGGELDQLETLVNGSFRDRPEIYQAMIVDRNLHWMPKIEALAEGDVPAIVIVGTGHLVGANGIVAMLRTKGYTVVQQ